MWSLVGSESSDVHHDVIVCSFRECSPKAETYILKKVANSFFSTIVFGITAI